MRDGVIWVAITSLPGKSNAPLTAVHNPFISRLRVHKVYTFIHRSFAIGVKKPNNLKYSEYMIQCCMSLREDIEHRADAYLLYLIQLQRLAEEVYETFHLEKLPSNTEMELLRLQKAVKAFNTRLQAWKASLPSDIRTSRKLPSSFSKEFPRELTYSI